LLVFICINDDYFLNKAMDNSINFDFHMPVKVNFGIGKAKSLNSYLNQKNSSQKIIFLVSKTFLKKNKNFEKLLKRWLSARNAELLVPDRFPAESEWIRETVSALKKKFKNIGIVVGIGGGTTMDAAKIISVCLSSSRPLEKLLAQKKPLKRKVKLILLPTTSGTGSELSKGAVMIDSDTGNRVSMKGLAIFADIAIIDPRLSQSCKNSCLKNAAFDALSHAIETYFSKKSNFATRSLSVYAIKKIFALKLKIKNNSFSKVNQEDLSLASSLMGINLALASTCLPHRLSYALPKEIQFDLSHSEAVSIFYPAWLDKLQKMCPNLVEKIDEELGYSVIKATELFMQCIKLNYSLKSIGIINDKKFLKYMSNRIRGDFSADPSYKNKNTILNILRNS
jgi:alcohol dehydrogenase class IV